MVEYIKKVNPEELDELLQALLARYREIYPDWEILFLSIYRRESREEQVDSIKEFLDKMIIEN